jgi:pilus assembly protein CpaE
MDTSLARTALVTGDPGFRDFLKETLRSIQGAPSVGLEVQAAYEEIGKDQIEQIREFGPELVFLDLGTEPLVGIRFAQFLSETDPLVRIVAVGPDLTPDLLLEAMRAGISEYLSRPVGEADLSDALARIRRKLRRGSEEDVEPGKLFALFAAKGGVGTTTAATNLAVQLHRVTGKKVLLIDLDLELGETALLLGVRPRFNFVDMVRNFHRMDADLLASYIERHESGVHLLSSPVRPERIEELSTDEVRAVLQFLKRHYDYIVVDTSKTFSPHSTAAFEQADLVLLLTTPDLPSLRNAKRSVPLLERVTGKGANRVRLVVNRASARTVITLDDIKRTLELDIFWTLANDYQAISASVNAGKPVVLNGTGSPYVRDIKALAGELAGLGGASPNSRLTLGPLSELLRRFKHREEEQVAEHG